MSEQTRASDPIFSLLPMQVETEAEDVQALAGGTLFCYQVKKWIGAFAAVLGGLDTRVLADGIGENAHRELVGPLLLCFRSTLRHDI